MPPPGLWTGGCYWLTQGHLLQDQLQEGEQITSCFKLPKVLDKQTRKGIQEIVDLAQGIKDAVMPAGPQFIEPTICTDC